MAGETEKEDSEREAEISLLDLFIVLLKYKWMILTFVLVAAILGFAYMEISSKQSEVKNLHVQGESVFYYSECLVEPDRDVMEKIKQIIIRRDFVLKMVEENHLQNELQQAILNEKKQSGGTGEQPAVQEVYGWLRQNLFITPSGTVLTLGFASSQNDLPSRIINAFLLSLSEFFRKRDLEILVNQQNLLRRHLANAQDSFLKAKIAEEIAKVMGKETRIRSEKYYGFELLDPPSLVDRVKITKKGNEKKIEALVGWTSPSLPSVSRTPKYMLLILLLILSSLVVSITLAFFLEYIHKMKAREPERMALLKRYLSIRRK